MRRHLAQTYWKHRDQHTQRRKVLSLKQQGNAAELQPEDLCWDWL
jgi:hypothetical protein